ncbi:MAG: nucleotidyltransferase substrate binding protein [Xanthomonadales bacterium]|nr:nucleotidyltransferase substrate binding protein [Xanthomonadales bacterium]
MSTATRIEEFQRTVDRLQEALALAGGNPLGVDASIQRFEFCVELAWKSLRDVLLRDHGIDVASPKPARFPPRGGIEYPDSWLRSCTCYPGGPVSRPAASTLPLR